MRAERAGRPDDGTEVAGVGDAVERDKERGRVEVGGVREEVVDVRVRVGRHLQREPLVDRSAAEPVDLGPRRLEQRHAARVGELEGLAHPVVAVDAHRDEQRGGRDAGPQRLDHAVAPRDELRGLLAAASPGPAARSAAGGRDLPRASGRGGRPLARGRRLACLRVPLARLGRRRRALAAQRAVGLAAGPLRRALAVRTRLVAPTAEAALVPPAMWSVPSQGPARSGRSVLDHDAGGRELVADRVGGGVVLAATGRGALLQRERSRARR